MRRVISLLMLATLLPLMLAGAMGAVLTLRAERTDLEDRARDLAAFTATLLSRELASNLRSVQMIAQSPALDHGLDQDRFSLLAGRLLAGEPSWRAISVSDTAGRRILDVPDANTGKLGGQVLEPASHRRVVGSGEPAVGDMAVGPRGRAAFAVRAPVIRDGKVVRVVSVVVDAPALRALVLADRTPPRWQVQVLDRLGAVVIDSGAPQAAGRGRVSPEALRVTEGLVRDGAPPGMVRLSRPVAQTGWTVRVLAPASQWDGPAQQALLVGLGAAVLGLAIAAAAGVRLWRELARQRRQEAIAGEARRLEALGRMTGGVAHDFNNLLTPILGGLDLLQKRLPPEPRTRRILDGALQSAETARRLVTRLLHFARSAPSESETTDVAELLRGLQDLIAHTVGRDVVPRLQVPDEPLWARVDANELELAILNLAVNARDAMPEGGEFTVCADRARSSGDDRLVAGPYVRIRVQDTGVGMDPETLKRSIEPFFTTKTMGRGTGLGLSIVHALATRSGGALLLSSRPGEGLSAEIWLPAAAAGPARPTPPAMTVDDRKGRILLVDDDELVRRATGDLLREHGHQVLEARSVGEALRRLETDAVDLVVTDFAMPDRTGADLIRELANQTGAPPVLLITGYAADADVPDDVPRLAKPYRQVELLARIAEQLPPCR